MWLGLPRPSRLGVASGVAWDGPRNDGFICFQKFIPSSHNTQRRHHEPTEALAKVGVVIQGNSRFHFA